MSETPSACRLPTVCSSAFPGRKKLQWSVEHIRRCEVCHEWNPKRKAALFEAEWLRHYYQRGRQVNKTARITIELSGRTLENLISLAVKLHRHPDDLTVDLLYAAIEASVDSTEAQVALMAQSSGGLLQ